MGDIYGIVRKDLDKICYIGQTIRTYKIRWQQHKQVAKNADKTRYALYAAIQKLGVDNFYPILIEQCENELLNEREKYWIKFYKTKVEYGGYNLTDGGDANSERQKKPVHQYSLDGQYINSFDSLEDAAWSFNTVSSLISRAAHGLINQSHGYRWSFKKVDHLEKEYVPNAKEIKQYTKEGEFIQSFPSIRQAALALGKTNNGAGSNICAAAKGKKQTAYGYKWSY